MSLTATQLRDKMGFVAGLSVQKSCPSRDKHSRKFISVSLLLMLSTASATIKAVAR